MKKIILILPITILLTACVPSALMNSDMMGEAKLDYKPDIENRLGKSGLYLVPVNPDKINFDSFYSYQFKNISGIKNNESHFEKNKFLIQKAYTDKNKSKVDAIVVYAVKKDAKIDANALTVKTINEFARSQKISQILSFRKSHNYQKFWSVRIPGIHIKKVPEGSSTRKVRKKGLLSSQGLFGKDHKKENPVLLFTYKELNQFSKKLTKTTINKEYYNCCIKNASFTASVSNKSGGTKTDKGSISMNIDEVPAFRHLIVLPAVITEIHEVKGEKMGNGYKVTKESKVLGVSNKLQKRIAEALAANFKSVRTPGKEFSKWYVKQMEVTQSRVGKVSASEALLDMGHMMGITNEDTIHKNAHPAEIIRLQADPSKLEENSAYVSVEITRIISDFNTGITDGEEEIVILNMQIYDVRRASPRVQSLKGGLLDLAVQSSDAPSLQYVRRYSNLGGRSTVSFMNRNSNTIKNTIKEMIKWKAKDLDIEFKNRKINIAQYDDLGIQAIAK